jgi:shikimate kinase/3-dehydroquinate synthase
MSEKTNIILTGFSFTGKSAVGREVAQRLGWRFADSDDEIVALAGKDIPDIFAGDGERRFRALERQVLASICEKEGYVVATGGGAVVDPGNRELFSRCGVVVCLEAAPETIHKRLVAAQEAYQTVRPLLAVEDPLGHIRSLKADRQPFYDKADWSVCTDNLNLGHVVDRVIDGFKQVSTRNSDPAYFEGASSVVVTSSQTYPVFVGWGTLAKLGRQMAQTGLSKHAAVISDEEVFPHYGKHVTEALEEAGFSVESLVVPAGENTKSLDSATLIYDWLVEHRTERTHSIVALGGGMVGDLAGFVAATFLRGLPLVHVPTTLVAMADSSIGGKVAVNHPQAKNIIGAFHQPHLVAIDAVTLSTLPRRELVSGWAEVIKHALTLDPDFLVFLEANADGLAGLEAEMTTEAIRRSGSLKAMVVSEDERESGKRMILNYGHTIGHGLEAAMGYEHYLHGEAVSIGMIGAALLSERLGLISEDTVARQRALLQRFGLPTACPGVDAANVTRAMELDKKVREKAIRWVLLEGIGQPVFRDDVPPGQVLGVIEELAQN